MNVLAPNAPWILSFSYARALQDDAMRTWAGRTENVRAAQTAFHRRAKMNSLARHGKWSMALEKAA
jgi:fructose-bisphosphate aldolase class I